ncbi:MAG: flippase-like domain-containing protein [Aquificae bacterium]|nr:flippase-like domain-containing protein [Aquificota bacterium]
MLKTFLKGLLLFALFFLSSLFYLLYESFSPESLGLLLTLDKRFLALALFFVFLAHTFDNLRLFVLARAFGVKYSFLYGYAVSFVNSFGATVTPAHLGGEGSAVYMLMRKGARAHQVALIVTLKTVTGLSFFLLALPFVAYQLFKRPEETLRVLLLVLGSALLVGLLYLMGRRNAERRTVKKLKQFLLRYAAGLRSFYRKGKAVFFLACLFGVLLYLSFLAVGVALLYAFGRSVDPLTALYDQLTLLYAIFISPTPGGSGVGELGGLVVFSKYLPKTELGLFVLLWRFLSQYASAFLGGLLLTLCLITDLKRLS